MAASKKLSLMPLILIIIVLAIVAALSKNTFNTITSPKGPTNTVQIDDKLSQELQKAHAKKNLLAKQVAGKQLKYASPRQAPGKLLVHFLDVGQADAILVQLPDSKTILIDAGNTNDGKFIVSYLKKAGVKKINFLVTTHPHEDHIGGMTNVIKHFPISEVIMPNTVNTTHAFRQMLNVIRTKKITVNKAIAGNSILAEKNLHVAILAPQDTKYDNLNDYSVVLKLTYGQIRFLFEGDAQNLSENEILASGADVKADVLKIGHHGSHSSTSEDYLSQVDPKYAVISVGTNNDYGHPHLETLQRLQNHEVKLFRTDLDGTIIFSSDGKKLNIFKSRLRHPD